MRLFAATFMTNYVTVQNKVSEQLSKERILRNHLLPAFGDLAIDELSTKHIDHYIAEKKETLSAKSVNNHLAVLARMLRLSQEWGVVTKLPRVRFLRVVKPQIDFLNSHEISLLRAALPDGQIGKMVELALNTGMRLGELLALSWPAVDFSRRRLNVWRSLNDDGSLGSPKSGKHRGIPLNAQAEAALLALGPQATGFVFKRSDGNNAPLTRMLAYRPLIQAMRKAGLDHADGGRKRRLGWHMLRHTFASQLVMLGVPMRAIQDLLGHASMDMTLRYAHLAPALTKAAVDLLSR